MKINIDGHTIEGTATEIATLLKAIENIDEQKTEQPTQEEQQPTTFPIFYRQPTKKGTPVVQFKNCKNCGKQFKPRSNRQEYCSEKCHYDFNNHKKIKKKKRLNVRHRTNCKNCGKGFLAKKRTTSFCSPKCYNYWKYHNDTDFRTRELERVRNYNHGKKKPDQEVVIKQPRQESSEKTDRHLWITSRANYLQRNNPILSREKAWVIASLEWTQKEKIGMISSSKQAAMPTFKNLREDLVPILEGMIKNILKTGQSINYRDASYTLDLPTTEIWNDFVAEFLTKTNDISFVIGIPNKFRIERAGKYLEIRYNGGKAI